MARRSLCIAALLLFLAPAAHALPYTGSLQLELHSFPPGPIELSTLPGGTGSGAGGGAVVLATGSVGGSTTLVGTPAPFTTFFVHARLNAPASLPGVAPVVGFYRISATPNLNLSVPLAVVGATTGATAMVTNQVTVTAKALGAWTVGMATVTTTRPTPTMNQHFATGFDTRTAAGRGTVQLVSPVLVNTSIGVFSSLPLFGTLTLTFTPEPGTLLLLGTGVAALAALGRRRLRR